MTIIVVYIVNPLYHTVCGLTKKKVYPSAMLTKLVMPRCSLMLLLKKVMKSQVTFCSKKCNERMEGA